MSTKTDREICEAAAKSLGMGRAYFNDGLSYVPYADFITRFTPTDVKELIDQIESLEKRNAELIKKKEIETKLANDYINVSDSLLEKNEALEKQYAELLELFGEKKRAND